MANYAGVQCIVTSHEICACVYACTCVYIRMHVCVCIHMHVCVYTHACVCVCVFACMCVCVCPSSRLLLTSGVIWTPYDWLNKLYSFYTAVVVGIVSGCGITIDVHCGNQPNKS